MPRYGQLVMGPAGSGKSTFCSTIFRHCETIRRKVRVVNLDPAAEQFDYPVEIDVRDLIQLEDCMEADELRLGPNGGLMYCMEYIAENMNWLRDEIGDGEDDYWIFDCPGQIEIYTHSPVMRKIVETLHSWDFRIAGVFVLEAQFVIDCTKFVSGVLSALSCMLSLEIPHVNVITKLDLLGARGREELQRYLVPDLPSLLAGELDQKHFSKRYKRLNQALAGIIDDFSIVQFTSINVDDEESIEDCLLQIDLTIQYGEDLEPREPQELDEPDSDSGVGYGDE